MAILVGGNKAAFSGFFDFTDLTEGSVTVATATTYRITRGASYEQFTGNFNLHRWRPNRRHDDRLDPGHQWRC